MKSSSTPLTFGSAAKETTYDNKIKQLGKNGVGACAGRRWNGQK